MTRFLSVAAVVALASGAAVWAQTECRAFAPCYRAEGIVNSASGEAGALAPYTFATIYGENLAYQTRGRVADDTDAGLGGVQVLVNRQRAMVFYVSPGQVNLLIPNTIAVGPATIRLAREGSEGPTVTVTIQDVAPAIFTVDPTTVVAQRMPGYQVATPDAPARPGEYVVLYATGLGRYAKLSDEYDPPHAATIMDRRRDLQLFLDGVAVEDHLIEYAGTVVGYWGLYQINLKLPASGIGDNPEVRIAVSGKLSPAALHIPLRNL